MSSFPTYYSYSNSIARAGIPGYNLGIECGAATYGYSIPSILPIENPLRLLISPLGIPVSTDTLRYEYKKATEYF